jgi:hypothetical protein
MRQNLDQIDWVKLEAQSIPVLLKCLISSDANIQIRAYKALSRKVVRLPTADQSGVSHVLRNELQQVVASFLVDILIHEKRANEENILSLLADFSVYPLCLYGVGEPYLTRLLELQVEISRGIDVYLVLLCSPNKIAEKRHALFIISQQEKFDELLVNQLMVCLPNETDSEIRRYETWMLCEKAPKIGKVDYEQGNIIDLINNFLEQDKDEKLRVVAAACLLIMQGQNVSPQAVEIVVEALKSLDSTDVYLGYLWGRDFYRLNQALVKLGPQKALPKLFELLQAQSVPKAIFHTLHAILHLAFSQGNLSVSYFNFPEPGLTPQLAKVTFSPRIGKMSIISQLSKLQETTLKIILDNDLIWNYQTNLFEYYGLPNTRNELKDLLSL